MRERVFNRYSLSSMLKYHLIQELSGCNIYYDSFFENTVTMFTIDSKIPVKLVYNNYGILKYHDDYRFNFSETLEIRYQDGFEYIIHKDGLSRIRRFHKKENYYVCENDNHLIIEEKDNYYYMTDEDGNKKTFIKDKKRNCYLIEYIRNNKKIEIELSSSYRITKISSGSYEIEVSYVNGRLTKIHNKTLDIDLFYRDNKKYVLKTANGTTTFMLNPKHLIKSIHENNITYRYDYSYDKPYRPYRIRKINQDNIVENSYILREEINKTIIPSHKKEIQIFEYDGENRLLSSDKIKI